MRHDPAAGAVVIMLRSQEKDDDKTPLDPSLTRNPY